MKLNLGCGWDKKEGFLNIDIAKETNPDIIHDLNNGLGFIKDNEVKYIFSSHTLEHIKPDNYLELISEMGRVSQHGCIWELELPFDNIVTRTNNSHYRSYAWNSFAQYYKNNTFRNYYMPHFSLIPLHKEASFLQKLFFNIFPFLKTEVKFKFLVIKK